MSDKFKFNGVMIEEYPDPRNYTISMFIPGEDIVPDEEFCLKLPKLDIILNQKQFSSCVGHSYAIAKSILEYQRTNKWIDIDPYAIYGTRYAGEYTGLGMYSWQGAKVLLKEGAFLRRDFGIQQEVPQLIDTLREWKQKNPDKVQDAKNLTITAYYNVNNVNDYKKSLKNGMPISVAYPIYTSFYNVKDDGKVSLKKSSDKLEGYHQMTVVGWTRDNYWIVLNSWGTDRGLKGVYLIPFNYEYNSATVVSDTFSPLKHKAKEIEFTVNSKQFKIDGEIKEFDVAPFIKDDRTYVPVRFITEALGASVEWVPDDRKVIVRSEEAKVTMEIDRNAIWIDGQIDLLDAPPILYQDRTMLPIRAVAEALNCNVDWKNGNIIIKSL